MNFYLQWSLIIIDHLSKLLIIILSLFQFHYLINFPNCKLMKTSHGLIGSNSNLSLIFFLCSFCAKNDFKENWTVYHILSNTILLTKDIIRFGQKPSAVQTRLMLTLKKLKRNFCSIALFTRKQNWSRQFCWMTICVSLTQISVPLLSKEAFLL